MFDHITEEVSIRIPDWTKEVDNYCVFRLKDQTHDATLRTTLCTVVLGRVDTCCNITCNIDGVATKLCKQGNLIG